MTDARTFLEHLEFITVRAMRDDFWGITRVEYDFAVRRLAETKGFEAFPPGPHGHERQALWRPEHAFRKR